ncbi:hypothetical protein EBR77_03025 [bacterium]|nr:hypothetical protein [bacterium]NBX78154.1 hypothetical protein [bacterium]
MKTVKNTLFVAMLAMASVSVAIDTTDIVLAIDAMHAPVKQKAQNWFEYAKSFVPTMPTFADVKTRAQAAYTTSKDAVLALPGQAYSAGENTVKFAKENPVTSAAIAAGVVTAGTLVYFYGSDAYNYVFGSEAKKVEAPEVAETPVKQVKSETPVETPKRHQRVKSHYRK